MSTATTATTATTTPAAGFAPQADDDYLLEPVYGPQHVASTDYQRDLGEPGQPTPRQARCSASSASGAGWATTRST